MTRRDLLLALLFFVAGAAAIQWINVGLLCRGDPKLDVGCGPVGLYLIDDVVVLGPTMLIGVLRAWASTSVTVARQILSVSVLLAIAGGIAIALGRWYTWSALSGVGLVTTMAIAVGSTVARSLRSRP